MQLALNCDIQLSFRKEWILFVDLVSILLSFIYAHHEYFSVVFSCKGHSRVISSCTRLWDPKLFPSFIDPKLPFFMYRSKAPFFHVQIQCFFFSCIYRKHLFFCIDSKFFFVYRSKASFFMYRSKVSFLCMDPWPLFLNVYEKRSRGSIHPKQALDLYI